jgi:6-pyruvoyl-tetrahydropterin synthase
MTLRIVRVAFFSSGHAYNAEEKYGHNFKLEAHFQHSQPDAKVEDYGLVEKAVKEVADLLDHRFLNDAVPAFKDKPATPETIAQFCLQEISKRTARPHLRLIKTRIFEGESIWADAYAADATQSERDF